MLSTDDGLSKPGAPGAIQLPAPDKLKELITTAVFFLGPVAYFFGFLISNYYYLSQGVLSVGLVRSEYILAGIWFIVVTVGNYIVARLFQYFYEGWKEPQHIIYRLLLLWFALLLFLVYFYLLAPGADLLTVSNMSDWLAPHVPITYFQVNFFFSLLGFTGTAFLARQSVLKDRKSLQDHFRNPLVAGLTAALLLADVGIMIIPYDLTIFPRTSSLLAGGKPVVGVINCEKDANTGLTEGKTYYIVFRNEKTVYVRDPSRKTVWEVKADKITSIEYLPYRNVLMPALKVDSPTPKPTLGPPQRLFRK